MSLVNVTTSYATRTSPGHLDNPERWKAARVTASHLNTFLQLIKRSDPAVYSGDEFESAKHLMQHVQASCGLFLDELHTASTLDQLIQINNEFYKIASSKS